jgi:hypothetical protein
MHQFDEALVEKMKNTARKHPHWPEPGRMAPEQCLWKNVTFEDEDLNIMLTYELHGNIKAWHLSVGRSNDTPAPQDIADHIVGVVLGPDVHVLPEHYFPPECRFMKQYVQRITDE